MSEVQWKRTEGGIDVLVDERGEILASCRLTDQRTYKAQYRAESFREFFSRADAWSAMFKRHTEFMTEPPQKKEKSGAGKNP